HNWMTESGIRWGIDAAHRKKLGLPESERYSFSDGLHRLFLGYALPSGNQIPFGQRMPASNPEGSSAAALGSLQQFMRQLSGLQRDLREPKTADVWMQALLSLTNRFMRPMDNELDDWREVQQHVRELCEQMQRGGEQLAIALDVMQTALTASLDEATWANVPTGMVTFTSIGGLRNLPYKIVCAIGLNDGSFPTTKRPAEFDLMAISPQAGDRQRRNDERNLFLDLLLATRERLYLSYTGRNVRDNSPMPPSVLIADLLDYLIPAIGSADARQRLVVEHPLQPFSTASFQHDSNPRILSSNGEYHHALKQKLLDPPAFAVPPAETDDEDEDEANDENTLSFFLEPLPPPGDEWREVSLDQLLRFFRNPSRFLLQQRLGMAFPEKLEELLDDEPFLPDRDEQNTLADRLLPLYLNGASRDDILASALAGTEYPPGELGQSLLEQELRALDAFAQKWRQQTSRPTLPPVSQTLEFPIDGETWRLTGTFGDLRPDGLIRCRFDNVRPTDYLAGWIAHLFLNAMMPDGVKPQTVWHSRDGEYTLNPISDAREQLQQLLTLYRKGLSAPLHFYPKSAWEYASNNNDLNKANGKWRGGRNEEFSESHDPAYRQALRGVPNPLDGAFETCAQTVFQPLLAHIDDPRLDA
ncbi:MAG: exodeoxyribonuclease V subunit gamma, partial [Burkholderiaceae bacterium]|nr:exodeoxyribonuclease V subunit gamma [Burkholderiaceae bacterium]